MTGSRVREMGKLYGVMPVRCQINSEISPIQGTQKKLNLLSENNTTCENVNRLSFNKQYISMPKKCDIINPYPTNVENRVSS